MAEVLKGLPREINPDLLVGTNTADDAGVFRINDRQALVQTVDFFPPIVDDPYCFGQIAAANALSDIYAMGGKPLTALNIVGFPARMPREILGRILRGGADKVREAGAVIAGGHSIVDKELKYGLACTGMVDVDKIIRNDKAVIGDRLFLTKPLGTGIVTTAIKQKKATPEDTDHVINRMSELNRVGSELMVKFGAHAATDVTGYGILGHGFEMAVGSEVSLHIYYDRLPLLPNVLKYAEAGALTGGAEANREYLQTAVKISSLLSKAQTDVLFDAQTSGGLLIAMPDTGADSFVEEAGERGLTIEQIGIVEQKGQFAIIVD